MHLVEQVGSGIGRIQDLMKSAGLPEPIFQKEGIFTVILKRPSLISGQTTQKTTQKTAPEIIHLIAQNPDITRQQMAEAIGITDNGVKYHLRKMQEKSLIRRIGPDKGGHWEIVQSESGKQDARSH